jgi:hypothetical protein
VHLALPTGTIGTYLGDLAEPKCTLLLLGDDDLALENGGHFERTVRCFSVQLRIAN